MTELFTPDELERERAAFFALCDQWHADTVSSIERAAAESFALTGRRSMQADECTDADAHAARLSSAAATRLYGRNRMPFTFTPGTTAAPVTRPYVPCGTVRGRGGFRAVTDRVATDAPDLTDSERADLIRAGITVPSGVIARTGRWVFRYGVRDALIDLLARDRFTVTVRLIPSDTSIVSGDLAARLTYRFAASAVQRAIRQADEWLAHAAELTDAAAVTFADGISEQYRQAARWDRTARVSGDTRWMPPTAAMVIAQSVDPMRKTRFNDRLQRAASDLIRLTSTGTDMMPDVWIKAKQTFVCKPYRVAFRGVDRYALPAPVRYGANGLMRAVEYALGRVFVVSADGIATAAPVAIGEALTSAARPRPFNRSGDNARHTVEVLTYSPDTRSIIGPMIRGPLIARRTVFVTYKLRDNGNRHGWRGHRRIEWQAAVRVGSHTARTVKRAAARRPDATATVGRAVGPWNMSARSLPVAIATRGLADVVAAIENAIRTADDQTAVTFADGTSVTVSGAAAVLASDGRAYPVREYARRYALATATRG